MSALDAPATYTGLLNPKHYDAAEFDEPTRRVLLATIAWFEAKGKQALTRESLTSTGTRFLGMTWPRARELGPLLVIWLVSLGIIVLQRDLGTGVLIFGMFVAMLYVATGKTSWVLIGVVLAVSGAFLASRILPYVGARFTNWLDAFNPELMDNSSYQLVNGIFGMAKRR